MKLQPSRLFSLLRAGLALGVLTCLPLRAELLIKNGETIAFLGDSITAGGWNDVGGYVRLVVDGLAKQGVVVKPIPAGVSGNKSNDMLARLDRDVLSKRPDWMTLSCGVNDVWHGKNGVDLETYKKNITAIVDRAEAQGVKVVMLTATPIFEDLKNAQNTTLADYNAFLRTFAAERKLPLADLGDGFSITLEKLSASKDSRHLTIDGVHMNPEGNLLMAKGVLAALGVDAAQRAELEQTWLAQPDTAFLSTGNFDPRPRVGITLAQFRVIQKLASEQGVDYTKYNLTLWYKCLNEVLKKYAGQTVIDGEQVKRETAAALVAKLDELTRR